MAEQCDRSQSVHGPLKEIEKHVSSTLFEVSLLSRCFFPGDFLVQFTATANFKLYLSLLTEHVCGSN
jgi:hypothetical protein